VDLRSLGWLISQLFHLHQFPCVLTLIPVCSYSLLSFSPGNYIIPRRIKNVSGNRQGP